MKNITGYKEKSSNMEEGDAVKANESNVFFNRFDNTATAAGDYGLHTTSQRDQNVSA